MITIYDVAKKAGVSPSTVSRVLNKYDNVTEKTRIKVIKACNDLNFIPNANASNLKKRTTRTLALFIPDIENPFFTSVLKGFEGKAFKSGYNTIVCDTDENFELEKSYTQMVLEKRIDGVAVSTISRTKEHLEKIVSRKIPLVLIDRKIKDFNVDIVCGDSTQGARDLVRHLLEQGYSKIAMIIASQHLSTSRERIEGYKSVLREARIDINHSYIKVDKENDGYSREAAYQMTKELLTECQESDRPDSIFAGNNLMALGVYQAVREMGLKVPEEMAIVCFDNLNLTYEIEPFFTAAVQPAYTMGMMAADILINRIEENYEGNVQQVILKPDIEIRKSSLGGD